MGKTSRFVPAERWIIERTFAWRSAKHGLSKEYDRILRHTNALITGTDIRRIHYYC